MVLSETNYLNLNKNKKACIDDMFYAGQLKQHVRQNTMLCVELFTNKKKCK